MGAGRARPRCLNLWAPGPGRAAPGLKSQSLNACDRMAAAREPRLRANTNQNRRGPNATREAFMRTPQCPERARRPACTPGRGPRVALRALATDDPQRPSPRPPRLSVRRRAFPPANV
eukprot:244783-Pyramimonas_sp.AAC.1